MHIGLVGVGKQETRFIRWLHLKHGHDGCIAHIFVGTGHIQFVRTQARAGLGRIRLNGVALVQQPFVVQLFKQTPYRLDVVIFVGYVGVFQIDPVPNSLGEVVPLVGKPHHGFAAFLVVGLHRNRLTDVLFGNTQLFFDLQLNGQAMRIPAALALHLKTPKRFIAAKYVFYSPGHHVVNTRRSVGRGWPLIKRKRGATFAHPHRFLKRIGFFPLLQHLSRNLCVVEGFVLLVLHHVGLYRRSGVETPRSM